MKSKLAAPTHFKHRGIGDAIVSRAIAWISVAVFLLLIASQLAVTLSNGSLADSLGAFWNASLEAVTGEAGQARSRNTRLHDAGERLEDDLTEASWLRQAVRAWGQLGLTRLGGVGNTQVYLGDRDAGSDNRWLFFAPATDHVLAPPFLDPGVQQRRAKAASAWDPRPRTDPLPAILQLADDLAERDIRLIVLPAPSKVSLEAERLTGRNPGSDTVDALVNPSYPLFLERLRDEGIGVVDPLPVIAALPADERFLLQDSHWSPQTVEAVAAAIAEEVRRESPDLDASTPYRRRRLTVDNTGDLVDLLGLPPGHSPGSQRVEIQPVFERNRSWRPDRNVPVLLLGDSFANVFSQEALGWGSGAGLAEQLSYHLRSPVDKIVVNAGGAHTAREAWARDLAGGVRSLDHLKVVVYEFASRELSWGDWRLLTVTGRR